MDGAAELLQLAYLLRAEAEAARDIAVLRTNDKDAIYSLAQEAEGLAARFEALAARGDVPDDAK